MATLATRIGDLATRIATECKAIRTLINGNAADLTALTTTAKNSLVAAINELKTTISGISSGAAINDATSATTSVWSSSKTSSQITSQINALLGAAPAALDTLAEIDAAIGNDANFATTMTTALGNRVRYDAAQTLTLAQKLQARNNIDAYGSVEIGNPDTDFVATFTAGLV
jgi:hypothetical protein